MPFFVTQTTPQSRDLASNPKSQKKILRVPGCPAGAAPGPHRVRLVLASIQFMAVIEDVLVGGVEAGLHTVLHHLAGAGRALQLLNLKAETGPGEDGRTVTS